MTIQKEKKMTNKLKYPFSKAFEREDSIDYRVGGWSKMSDHGYVEKLGYHVEMGSDCSCFARGLGGLSLSSYGDWGTLHTSSAENKVKEMFLDMVEKDIVRPWRITAYIKMDGEVESYSYENGVGWRTLIKDMHEWVDCSDPYRKYKL